MASEGEDIPQLIEQPSYEDIILEKANILLNAYEQEYANGRSSIIFTITGNDEECRDLRSAIRLKDPSLKIREYKFQSLMVILRKFVIYREPNQPAGVEESVGAEEDKEGETLPASTSDQNA